MAAGKKTGGRQKGSKNKATLEREQRAHGIAVAALEKGLDPLAVMLDNMKFAHGKAAALLEKMMASPDQPTTKEVKELLLLRQMSQECAKDAAPYIHPRLAAVEHSGDLTVTHETALEELEHKANGVELHQ